MESQWYLHDGKDQKGPFSESAVEEMASNGMLGEATMLWKNGMEQWIRYPDSIFYKKRMTLPPPLSANANSQPLRQMASASTTESLPPIKKTPVILIIFYVIITSGIYYPAWFLTRRQAINSLKSKERLEIGVFVFGIVILSLSLVLAIFSGFFKGLNDATGSQTFLMQSIGITAVSKLLSLIAGITLLVQCYKVRRILREHFNDYLGNNIKWSGAMIFFFQIFYLQYKINRLNEIALVKCPDCGKMVSNLAPACIGCGRPMLGK